MSKTILLVEDEAILGYTEKRLLSEKGFNVIHVCDGETAIETVKSNPESIDLILMDIDLGTGIDGTIAAKEILKDNDIPLIFLSSHTEKEVVEKTEQITSYGYAVKDADITVLLALIKMALKLYSTNKELKKSEERLKERKFWLKEAQKIARIGHYRLNIRTGEWSNSSMVNEIFGVPDDYFKQQGNWISLIHPEDKAGVMEYLGKCIIEQTPLKKEYRIIRQNDGSTLWIHDIARLTFDDSGEPVSLFGVIQDITERRRVEDALNESEKNFRQLIDNMGEGISFVDPNEVFHFANNAAERIFGVGPGELTGRNLSEFHDPEEMQKINLQTQTRQKRITSVFESVIRLKDGRKKTILVTGTPRIDQNGKVIGTFGIFRDITERKEAETLLKRYAEELKISNETKDKFFSILAHDLRGPFTGFMGMTEDLAKNIEELRKEEIVEYANVMHSVSTRLFGLLTNLLEWSRLQTGRMEHKPSEFNLLLEAYSATELFASAASEKSINITNEIDSRIKVYADNNMISGILRNLISNAVKFTPVGGRILLRSEEIGNFVEVSVSDNGVGMTEAEIERSFKIDSGFSTKGTNGEIGSGLGLVLCKEMVKKNGGEIRVKSEPGKGTTIIFSLLTAKHD